MNEDFNIDDFFDFFDIFLNLMNYADDKRTSQRKETDDKRTSLTKDSGRKQEFPTPFKLMMRMAMLDG